MVAVLTIGLAYSRFLWNLPRETRTSFVLAGCVYVGGAPGVEMIGAKHLSIVGTHSFTHSLLITVEEAAEMLGVVILLHAVLRHLSTDCGLVRLEIRGSDAQPVLTHAVHVNPRATGRTVPMGV